MEMLPTTEPLSDKVLSATCPVEMSGSTDGRCGRPLHIAAAGMDAHPVCLMHSRDLNKLVMPLAQDFLREFRMILSGANEGDAHFDGFIFPRLDCPGSKFSAKCFFDDAVFLERVGMDSVIFEQDVSFKGAIFEQDAVFSKVEMRTKSCFANAQFRQQTAFEGAIFGGSVDFSDATISGKVVFDKAEFNVNAGFNKTHFYGEAKFERTWFRHSADFFKAEFPKGVEFRETHFLRDVTLMEARFSGDTSFVDSHFYRFADWRYAEFGGRADFEIAEFRGTAEFSDTTFTGVTNFKRAQFATVNFSDAIFSSEVRFYMTEFSSTARWNGCKFMGSVAFRKIIFPSDTDNEPSATFAFATFANPKEVVFDDLDLSRVLFYNCDLSEVRFTTSARWGARSNYEGPRIYEEAISINHQAAHKLRRNGSRDYVAIAQIYQQLKKNYDGRLDYRMANECHYGEMEMKRLAIAPDQPLYGIRKWFLPRFGLVAWYRYASDYGNSYVKPIVWLVALLAGFAVLYPLPGVGLVRSGLSVAETYANVPQAKLTTVQNAGLELELVGRSLLAAIDVAGFQKSPEYSPAYPWGRVLAMVETLLTSTLFGLFLLAIRRQFRR